MNIHNIKKIISNLKKEEIRSKQILHMTANENIMSKTAQYFINSPLMSRYLIGSFDENKNLTSSISNLLYGLTLRGLPSIYSLEQTIYPYAQDMFSASYCDFKSLSGMHAVISVLTTITNPGDNVYVFATESVGHHATLSLLKNTGRKSHIIPWDYNNITIDLEQLKKVVNNNKPKLMLFDYGTPLFPLPIKEIRDIVGNDTILVYDGSHVMGLIAGKQFQDPLQEGCDILIGNSHKTFPGPQKGMIFYKNKSLGKQTADRIFHSVLSTQHTHHTIALYVTMLEMAEHGKRYAKQIIANNHALSNALINAGFKLYSKKCGQLPCSHIVTILGPFPKSNHTACDLLNLSGISTNARNMFGLNSIRIGVQELTRRGMTEQHMEMIANFYQKIIIGGCTSLLAEVLHFSAHFNTIHYSLDNYLFEEMNVEMFSNC